MKSATQLTDILNVLQLSENLYTAGQPTPGQLASLGQGGIRSVINLALPTSDNAVEDEASLITDQGINYFHIPVNWEAPSEENFRIFAGLLPVLDHQPLLVHCAMNMRVSAFIYLYRVVRLGMDHREALPDLLKIWTPFDQWYRFVNRIRQNHGLEATDFSQ